jgi:hypothetical protein
MYNWSFSGIPKGSGVSMILSRNRKRLIPSALSAAIAMVWLNSIGSAANVCTWTGGDTVHPGDWTLTTNWQSGTRPINIGDDADFSSGVINQTLGTLNWQLEAVDAGGASNTTITGSILGFAEGSSSFATPGIILESGYGSGSSTATFLIQAGVMPLNVSVTFNVKTRTSGSLVQHLRSGVLNKVAGDFERLPMKWQGSGDMEVAYDAWTQIGVAGGSG